MVLNDEKIEEDVAKHEHHTEDSEWELLWSYQAMSQSKRRVFQLGGTKNKAI